MLQEWLDKLEVREGYLYKSGKPVSNMAKDRDGYTKISFKKGGKNHSFLAHRVLFFIVHGWWPKVVDHKDRDVSNNHISNLRAASKAQNSHNSGKHRDNTNGFKGVRKTPAGKYQGRVMVNGTQHNAGNHNCPTAAFLATVNLRRKLHGEFSNTGEYSGR